MIVIVDNEGLRKALTASTQNSEELKRIRVYSDFAIARRLIILDFLGYSIHDFGLDASLPPDVDEESRGNIFEEGEKV